MTDRSRTFAAASAFAGLLAIVVGAFTLGNLGYAIGGSNTLATLTGRGLLLAGELAECAAYAIGALAWIALGGSRAAGWSVTVLKGLTLAGLLAIHWDRFWYYMLDLRGPDGLALIVVILSVLQAVLLCLAAVSAGNKGAA